MNIPKSCFPRVVIIGGGFAGIALAKKLSKKELQVVLLDKHNYHNFQPLLYQVSTGGLEPDSIAYPIRKVLKDFPNFYFRLANVSEINTEKNKVKSKKNRACGGLFYSISLVYSRNYSLKNSSLRRAVLLYPPCIQSKIFTKKSRLRRAILL